MYVVCQEETEKSNSARSVEPGRESSPNSETGYSGPFKLPLGKSWKARKGDQLGGLSIELFVCMFLVGNEK